ncbi:MAG: protein translocase subunit SecD [Methylobacteriaceae bacterium]|nr:protein translocase subunit SecD [Methylobacteriaceae bacterium]
MLRFATWKVVGVIASVIFAIFLVIPSFMSEASVKSWRASLPKIIPFSQIVLGLDLQGGAHLLLEVDAADVTKTQVTNLRDDIRRILREEQVSISGGIALQPRGVQFRVPDAAQRARVLPKTRNLAQSTGNALAGVTGGPSLQVTEGDDGLIQVAITEVGINDRVRRAVDQTIEVLRRRVDATGTREPNIQRQGADRVVVDVPGLQDTSQLKEILGTTAKLEFRLVAEPGTPAGERETLPNVEGGTIDVERRVMVQGEDLTDAQPGFDSRTSEPIVNFRFNIRGGQRFGEATAANVGRPFAIVLDNKVISAPRILSPITGGAGQISGRFTVEQTTNLSILLRAGALPAKLTVVEERTVGPGLGQDSIDAGKLAAYVAGVLVFAYMLMNYGVFGLFANLALAVHILFIFSALAWLGATLTLPGIAGVVFTIGLAVDSNVLIYERIREEFKGGRSILSSLDAGFKRAFGTIIDANVTTFVAAAILYLFGSGPVRGFAVSLGLGILTTVVTAVTMTRMMIALWYRWKRPTKLPI